MQGSLRAYSEEVKYEVVEKIKKIATASAEMFGCKAEVEIIYLYPAVVNHEIQASHVERIAKEHFGAEHFSKDEIPITASEDFSYFIENKYFLYLNL